MNKYHPQNAINESTGGVPPPWQAAAPELVRERIYVGTHSMQAIGAPSFFQKVVSNSEYLRLSAKPDYAAPNSKSCVQKVT